VNKGIKRLGIIASVIWIVAGGVWNLDTIEKAREGRISSTYTSCTRAADILRQTEDHCEAAMKAGYESLSGSAARHDQLTEASIGTLVPLVLAWVLAFVVTWLGRWVFAGFRSAI
jgi:hypothetical protein